VLTKGGTVEGYVYDHQGKAQGNPDVSNSIIFS
ncbi:unnamed protein product, partial [marine sediment metagenome]